MEATETSRRTSSLPGFETLVDFIEKAAEELTNPVYSDVHFHSSNESSNSQKFQQQRKRHEKYNSHAFATSAEKDNASISHARQDRQCVCCKGSYALFSMVSFLGIVSAKKV